MARKPNKEFGVIIIGRNEGERLRRCLASIDSDRAQIVYVQVASSHRDAAFGAAEFIMDYLKTDAVFWKRESGEVTDRWVESTEDDRLRRASWQEDA